MNLKTIVSALLGRRKPAGEVTTKLMYGRVAGVPDDAGDGFAWNAPWVLVSSTGKPLSEQAILQLSAVMACVRLLSNTIATLPFGMYRRLPNGGREATPDHILYELLHNQPNADMTAVDFWQVMVAWMMLRGVGYAEKDIIGGRLVSLDPLYVPNVTKVTKNGRTSYRYVDPDTSQQREIPEDRIWKLPAFTLDGKDGISPVCYGARVFGGAIAADEASQALFDNGMSASGFVTTPDKMWLTQEQRDKMRAHLDEFAYSAANSRKSFILEGGMDYKPLSMNPEDAQMLETRSFNVEEICRWFGVPPTLIGHGDKTSNWGTGLEQQNIGFLTYSLTPWLRKIEQSVRKNLLAPEEKRRYFGEFNVSGLLRGDTAARASYYSTMVNNGLMTRDEVRRLENLPAMGGNAEVLTVQTALSPLDDLGQQPDQTTQSTPADPADEVAKQ